MELKRLTLGAFGTNCFLVFTPENGVLFVIDPAAEAERIINEAKKFPYKSVRILLTHAHIDHISAAGKTAAALGVEYVELASGDHDMYHSKANAIEPYFKAAEDLPPVKDFQAMEYCKVISLPGHTRGGSGFLFDDGREKFLISGDTLFRGSIGRTDLYGGDYAELINSITGKLMLLPDDLTVYPGHDMETTIGFERRHNPYIN